MSGGGDDGTAPHMGVIRGGSVMKRGRHASPHRTVRRFPRARWAAAPLLSPFLFAFLVSSGNVAGNAGADQNPTTGSSYAQLLQVAPHEGSLAVGAIFGEALA